MRVSSNLVTDKQYYLDPAIRRKLDVLAYRCSRYNHQNVLATDGKEGYGKSTITASQAYYISYILKRKLRLYFKVDALSEDAKKNKDMIYIWDDAAISALTLEAYNKEILKFIKILLLARKKRHTYFLNIQEIFRMKEPIVARLSGLTRVYSPDKIHLGKFCHYHESTVMKMYEDYIRQKKKRYNAYSKLHGSFTDVLYKIFDEKEYEDLKDLSIESIGVEKEKKETVRGKLYKIRYDRMRRKAFELADAFGISQEDLAKHFKVEQPMISMWQYAGTDADVEDINHNPKQVIVTKEFIEPLPIVSDKPLEKVPIIIMERTRKVIKPEEKVYTSFI